MHVHSSEQVLNPESSNGDCKWRTLTRLIWVTVKGRNWLLLQKWLLTEVGSWQTIGGNICKFGWRKALQPKMKESTPWWQWPFAQTEENIGEVRRKYAARAPVWSPRTSVCPPFYTQLELEAVPKTIYDWLTVELNSSCVEDSIKSFWPLCFCLAGSHLESIKRSLFWLACNPTYSHEAVLGDSHHYFTTAQTRTCWKDTFWNFRRFKSVATLRRWDEWLSGHPVLENWK